MHECPYCGMACYCDGEDHGQPAPPDCACDCEEGDELVAEYDAENEPDDDDYPEVR